MTSIRQAPASGFLLQEALGRQEDSDDGSEVSDLTSAAASEAGLRTEGLRTDVPVEFTPLQVSTQRRAWAMELDMLKNQVARLSDRLDGSMLPPAVASSSPVPDHLASPNPHPQPNPQ